MEEETIEAQPLYADTCPPLTITFRGAGNTIYWFGGDGRHWPNLQVMDLTDLAVLHHFTRAIAERTAKALEQF